MKTWIFCLAFITIGIQVASGQTVIWESQPSARIKGNDRIQDAIKSSNLSTTNYNNDGIIDIPTLDWIRDSMFIKITTTIGSSNTVLFSKGIKFDPSLPIASAETVHLYFAEQPFKPRENKTNNDILLTFEKDDKAFLVIVVTVITDNEIVENSIDSSTPYIFLSSYDYDDDGLSELLIYNRDSETVQLLKL